MCDHIINETLYVMNKRINIVDLELNIAPKYECNFMKIFYSRLELYMFKDNNIVFDKKINEVFYDKS